MEKAGRNEMCRCGSGRKYKKCCALKQSNQRISKLLVVALLAALAGGVYAVVAGFNDEGSSIAAPGKIWSAEHGHYH